MEQDDDLCPKIATILSEREQRLAVAESLTGGLLSDRFASTSGASDWFAGGVVAYQKQVKFAVLDVPEGPVVTEEAVTAMAQGARRLLGADIAVAATGAGGPDPQDGQPPGTVWLAVVADGAAATTRLHHFGGDPKDVIDQAHEAAVVLLHEVLEAG